jgi:glycerol kinase
MLSETCTFYFQHRLLSIAYDIFSSSTGLPLSTYFSAIKLRWMIDNYPDVHKAHEADDLLFGTVESWVAYVSRTQSSFSLVTPFLYKK